MIALPTAKEVKDNVAAWSAANPALAAFLRAGLPVGEALTKWGFLLLKERRSSDATAAFQAALALEPNKPGRWLNCAFSFDQAGALPEAAACLEKSLALAPRQPEAWILLAMTRQKQNDYIAAEAACRQALALDSKLAPAWQRLGLIKEEQRDYPAAIDCLTTLVRLGGGNSAVFGNLGKLYHQTGKFPEALEAFQKAAALDPSNPHFGRMLAKTRFICDILRERPIVDALATYRESFVPPEVLQDSELIELVDRTVAMLGGFGHIDAAMRLGQKRLEMWPKGTTTAYLVQAMEGHSGLERSPQEFIVEHFDATAETFDTRLVYALGYDIPRKLVQAIASVTPASHRFDTLDAGCGTGLCGPLLREISRSLIAVDLSPKMLERARDRGVYDQLACEELTAFLQRSPAGFDLIIAADVFIYFGELTPLFSAAAGALRPGGLLAFSTEDGPASGYLLLQSGRFAHAPEYIRETASGNFTQELCEEAAIRLEAGKRLAGHLFLFRRR